ncbi:methyltransferase domain-containing protein [Altererythrobacter aquiaggeris]|uniref:methyltransferase domain-containing protein n=1 Tax=Aestuarierythrobacter aquiaggeris TaxID=1898396 RepID=UPI003018055A
MRFTPVQSSLNVLQGIPGAKSLARILRLAANADFRAVEQLRRDRDQRLLQPFPTTAENRYPALFDAVAQLLADNPEPRVLSFGCSSGEEVRAVRNRLPSARIIGVDINPRMIKMARRRDPEGDYRLSARPPSHGAFDAIFAMAVFRHGDLEASRPQNCASILSFKQFSEGVSALDDVMVSGGYLAIGNAHFRFADTATARLYDVVPLESAQPAPDLVYGPDNERLTEVADNQLLFRKVRA